MTALSLAEKVLAIGEIDDAGAAGELDTEMLYKLAPRLARIVQVLQASLQQKCLCYVDAPLKCFSCKDLAEADAIASGERSETNRIAKGEE